MVIHVIIRFNVSSFSQEAVSHTIVLEQEKQEAALRESIEGFEKTKLHRANTVEKNPLPDAESMSAFVIL